jgi:hypothetical protein
MLRRMGVVAAVGVVMSLSGGPAAGPISAEIALPLLKATQPPEACLMPEFSYGQSAVREDGESVGALAVPADWPGKEAGGGDVPPVRLVYDPYPTFDGMGIDPENNLVVFSDENRSGVLMQFFERPGAATAARR